MSPLGELLSCTRNHCRSISDTQLRSKLDSMYREAFEKAKISNPKLKDNIKLYTTEETSPNAVAVGTRTICLTRGLLNRPRDQIVAVLTHELSHIVYKDTAIQALMNAGDVCVRLSFFLESVNYDYFNTAYLDILFAGSHQKPVIHRKKRYSLKQLQ